MEVKKFTVHVESLPLGLRFGEFLCNNPNQKQSKLLVVEVLSTCSFPDEVSPFDEILLVNGAPVSDLRTLFHLCQSNQSPLTLTFQKSSSVSTFQDPRLQHVSQGEVVFYPWTIESATFLWPAKIERLPRHVDDFIGFRFFGGKVEDSPMEQAISAREFCPFLRGLSKAVTLLQQLMVDASKTGVLTEAIRQATLAFLDLYPVYTQASLAEAMTRKNRLRFMGLMKSSQLQKGDYVEASFNCRFDEQTEYPIYRITGITATGYNIKSAVDSVQNVNRAQLRLCEDPEKSLDSSRPSRKRERPDRAVAAPPEQKRGRRRVKRQKQAKQASPAAEGTVASQDSVRTPAPATTIFKHRLLQPLSSPSTPPQTAVKDHSLYTLEARMDSMQAPLPVPEAELRYELFCLLFEARWDGRSPPKPQQLRVDRRRRRADVVEWYDQFAQTLHQHPLPGIPPRPDPKVRIVVDASGSTVSVMHGSVRAFTLGVNPFAKLRHVFRGTPAWLPTHVLRLLLRYEVLLGSRGVHMQCPLNVLRDLKDLLSVNTELFASPLNFHLARYCSPLADDSHFASLGSFFDLKPGGGSFQAFPPPMSSYTAVEAQLVRLLSNTSEPVSILLILHGPHHTLEFPQLRSFLRSTLVLDPGSHTFVHEFRYKHPARTHIISQETTVLYLLQNDTGLAMYPWKPEYAAKIRRSFQKGMRHAAALNNKSN